MRIAPIIAGLLAVTLMSALSARAEEDVEPPIPAVERDLKLSAERITPEVIEPGQVIAAKLTLVNTSDSESYRVIKPGDGSGVGWREPHVFWHVERLGKDGKWTDVPRHGIGRCGVFDARWDKDVIAFAPRDRLELGGWTPSPGSGYELEAAGRYRLTARYAYRGRDKGETGKGGVNEDGIALMGNVKPFTISSEPIEVTVVQKFAFDVKVLGEVVAGTERTLSEILDVRVKNVTSGPLVLDKTNWRVQIRLWAQGEGDRVLVQADKAAKPVRLVPGASASLLGAHPLAGDADALLHTGDGTRPLAVAITLVSNTPGGPRYRTGKIEIPVRARD